MILLERLTPSLFIGWEPDELAVEPACRIVDYIPDSTGAYLDMAMDMDFNNIRHVGFECYLLEVTEVRAEFHDRIGAMLAQNSKLYQDSRCGKLQGVLRRIMQELAAAEAMHPNWPKEALHAGAVVAEEAGELLRDCVSYDETGDRNLLSAMQLEAVQTGAMAIRFLMNAPESNRRTIQHDIVARILASGQSDEDKLNALSIIIS